MGGRILFGTDFYMTLREATEAKLVGDCREKPGPERFERIAAVNTNNYLRSHHFDPSKRSLNTL